MQVVRQVRVLGIETLAKILFLKDDGYIGLMEGLRERGVLRSRLLATGKLEVIAGEDYMGIPRSVISTLKKF